MCSSLWMDLVLVFDVASERIGGQACILFSRAEESHPSLQVMLQHDRAQRLHLRFQCIGVF